MGPLTKLPFIEWNAHTNYSFLKSASHPEEMIAQAQLLGYAGIAITDRDGVYGIPRAHVTAKSVGLSFFIGAEVSPFPGVDLILVAQSRLGYGNLCEWLTEYHTKSAFPLFYEKREDLLALLPVTPELSEHLATFQTLFPGKIYLLASQYFDGRNTLTLELAESFSKKWQLPVLASQRPLFHVPQRKPLQDVLTCIDHTVTLKTAGFRLLPNAERYLKSPQDIYSLFQKYPQWIENTLKVAERISFSLDEITYRYPSEWLPAGENASSYLRKLTFEGARHRYSADIPFAVRKQMEHELKLIEELSYEDYFLTIWDIVQFAQRKGILYQGRGSAANSIVCYLLGITAIDPVRMDLLFERFISRERKEPPDIDIDFEHERREEVIQYIYSRYGRHRAAITAEVICFRRRSALREVGKAFGFALSDVERLLTVTHRRSLNDIPDSEWQAAIPEIPLRTIRQYQLLTQQILSFPRHLGTHVGGFVLCQEALNRNVPIEDAAMPERTIVQWDKNDLDALGFVRVDILGLGILTCIRKCLEIVKEIYGVSLSLATIPPEDPAIYESLCQADTIGVFQIESRAQMNMLPRLKPRNFFDLVVEVSLVRPGPIQGEMVHPYLRRRSGKEKVEYAHPELEAILKKTYGVPLFQEQIMKMAMRIGGFTAGEADELRRAMGSWRRHGKSRLTQLGEKLSQGLLLNGVRQEFADRICGQIEGFAEYGFPESHAASFSLLAYATAYLKYYYPDAYLTAILNSQPMGFYSSHSLIEDGKRHGVRVLPIDVQLSLWDNKLELKNAMRLGFREIKGLSKEVGSAIEVARKEKTFSGFQDFILRVKERAPRLSKRDLFLIASAHGFESLGFSRREALWEIQGLSLSDNPFFQAPDDGTTILKSEKPWEQILLDYEVQGVSLFQHPMKFVREDLNLKRAVDSQKIKEIATGKLVTVAGIVICRQMPPTASGVLFITLEDEYGFMNLVIWNSVYEAFKETLITQSFLLVEGRVERAEGTNVIHVIVEHAYPLFASYPKSLNARKNFG